MNKLRAALVCTGMLLSLQTYAQKRYNTPPLNPPVGTLPMQFNGGFAGEAQDHRVVAGAGIYLHSSNNYFLSYDKFISKLRSGIGFEYSRYQHSGVFYVPFENTGIFTRAKSSVDNLTATLSPKFSFKGKYTLAPFVSYTYSMSVMRPDDNTIAGYKHDSNHLSGGFLFNTTKFYAGAKINLYSTYGVGTHIALQTGYTFQKTPASHFSVTPQLLAILSENHRPTHWNTMFRYKKFLWSLNSVNLRDLGAGLGVQLDNFRVHATLSSIVDFKTPISYNGITGALSVRYIFTRGKDENRAGSMF